MRNHKKLGKDKNKKLKKKFTLIPNYIFMNFFSYYNIINIKLKN